MSFENDPHKQLVLLSVPRWNLITDFTVLLQVVGYAFDQVDDHLHTPYHETVYSLLDTLSPAYRDAFGNALLQRLEALKRDGQSWLSSFLVEGRRLLQNTGVKLETLAYGHRRKCIFGFVFSSFLASHLAFDSEHYWLINHLS